MFQQLFHPAPKPRFAPAMFLFLTAVFVSLLYSRPVVGLTGLGTVLILSAALVQLNRESIWKNYQKSYKKSKGMSARFTEPKMIYYQLNIIVLWPLVTGLGILCLYFAYTY